jgi:5-methylcytosine-specific restriction enzyme A
MRKPQRIKAHAPRVPMTDTRAVKPQRQLNPFSHIYGSQEWRNFSKAMIAAAGHQCQARECQKPDRGYGGPLVCDHIVELMDGGPAYDRANIEVRCYACHTTKTAEERRKRMARRW